jgi:uncharacterized protein YegL
MKQGYTHITILLDKSGSMGSLQKDMIGSFNAFVKKQKETPGEATLTLSLFSGYVNWEGWFDSPINFSPIAKVDDLTPAQYTPSGSTPLLDAIARAIKETGERLASLSEDERPDGVMFMIMTDGEENASRTHNNHQIAAMIKEQAEKYNWVFSYVGANQDSFSVARQYGIAQGNVLNFAASGAGAQAVTHAMGETVSTYRGMSLHEKSAGGQSLYANTNDESGLIEKSKTVTEVKKVATTRVKVRK